MTLPRLKTKRYQIYLTLLLGSLLPGVSLQADTVTLKNMAKYENAITFIQGDQLNIVLRDGDLVVLKKSQVKSLEKFEVNWSTSEIEKRIAQLKKSLKEKTLFQKKRGILIRSALIPGWGHLFAEEEKAGWGYLGGSALLALYSRNQYQELLSQKNQYQSRSSINWLGVYLDRPFPELSILINDRLRRDYLSKARQYNNSLNLIGLLYGVQLIHALVSAFNYDIKDDESESSGLNFFWDFSSSHYNAHHSHLMFSNHRNEVKFGISYHL